MNVIPFWLAIQQLTWICREVAGLSLKVKSYSLPKLGCIFNLVFTVGAVTFYVRGQTCNFFADLVRAYVFQQLLYRTNALTPSGSKGRIHGVLSPQYQRYGEKILIGSYLNSISQLNPVLLWRACNPHYLRKKTIKECFRYFFCFSSLKTAAALRTWIIFLF